MSFGQKKTLGEWARDRVTDSIPESQLWVDSIELIADMDGCCVPEEFQGLSNSPARISDMQDSTLFHFVMQDFIPSY